MPKKANKIMIAAIVIGILVIIAYLQLPPKPVKIGFVTDLSSRKSQLGVIARNGVLMAVDEIIEKGGINNRKIELFIRDHKSNKEECRKAVLELAEMGVHVIIGPLVSSMAQTVISAAAQHNTLVISPTVSTDELSGIDDLFLRVNAPASDHGRNLAAAAMHNKNTKIVTVLDEKNIEYSGAVARGFKEKFTGNDQFTVEQVLFKGKQSIPKVVEDINAVSPDGIVLITSGIDAAAVIQQYGKKYDVPNLYGSLWTKATRIHQYGGRKVDGMILVDSFKNIEPTEREKKFDRLYTDRFKMKPNFAARYAYESVYLFALALEKSGKTGSHLIKAEIINTDPIRGITDDYKMDQFGDVIRKQSLYMLKDNKYEVLSIPDQEGE